MIKLQLIGNLGGDAVVRQVGENQVINFSVGVDQSYTKDGVRQERTTWVECNKWVNANGSTAVAQYLKKGTKVYVSGDPEVRAYLKDNEARCTQSCRVQEIELLGNRGDSNNSSTTQTQPATSTPNPNSKPGDDDLPF